MAGSADKKAVSILVPSKDPKKKKDGDKGGKDNGEVPALGGVGVPGTGNSKGAGKGGKKGKGGKDAVEPEELSEEDKALKEGLELAVTRVEDVEPGIGMFHWRMSWLFFIGSWNVSVGVQFEASSINSSTPFPTT